MPPIHNKGGMEETPSPPQPQPQAVHASPPFPAVFTPLSALSSASARGSPTIPSPGAPAHFSTPPGPPVFSSPLRPAAVPFRTTPASPQPVPFAAHAASSASSSVSLPTSSTPHFLNGAATPHSHLPSAGSPLDDASVDSPYVLFSARKADNDPIAPSRGIPREDIKANPNCLLMVTPQGGHLGLVAGDEAPFGCPWTDPIVMEFLEHLQNETSSSTKNSTSYEQQSVPQTSVPHLSVHVQK